MLMFFLAPSLFSDDELESVFAKSTAETELSVALMVNNPTGE